VKEKQKSQIKGRGANDRHEREIQTQALQLQKHAITKEPTDN
jgi:hypothetical protein